MMGYDHYTVKYRNEEGIKIELCVSGANVTEAIAAAQDEIPVLKLYPGRICSVIGGCQ